MGKQAPVKVWDKVYQTGKKLSAEAMKLHETAIDRINESIGKWFVTIEPKLKPYKSKLFICQVIQLNIRLKNFVIPVSLF